MTSKPKLEAKDFVPILGAMKYITRYVYGVSNLDNSNKLPKYLMKGTAEIIGLTFYNVAIINITLKGLENLL